MLDSSSRRAAVTLLIDGHVHIHTCYRLNVLFDSAWANFRRAALSLELQENSWQGCLLLSEGAHEDAFAELRAASEGGRLAGEWRVCPTAEKIVLRAEGEGGRRLWLVAGRQVTSREDLEVLAIGVTEKPADGLPIDDVIDWTRRRDAVPVLAWGFGKWWFGRGRRIRRLLQAGSPRELLLGDNAGRPQPSLPPVLFIEGRRRGFRILPGTDCLPYRGEAARTASYGFALAGWDPTRAPGWQLKQRLLNLPAQPSVFGRRAGWGTFVAAQLRMQARKRLSRRRMRILAIAPQPFFSPRGTPLSVYYRCRSMAEQGAHIDLLTYGEGQDVDIPNLRIMRIPRVPGLGSIPAGPSVKKLLLDGLMVLWTTGLLIRHRYSLVHAHEEAVFWCRFLKPLFGFRLIYDMHSSLPEQLKNFRFTRSRLPVWIFSRLERTSLAASDAVVTVCPELRDHALAAGVPARRQVLIENSVFDDVRLANGAVPAGEGASPPAVLPELPRPTCLVLYAGTFEAYQGLDLLLRAFALLVQRVANAHLLLVGGAAGQIQRMRALAQELDIAGSCSFTGQVSKRAATACIARADVLVSPRIHGINTPMKIYEELASGKPLVATRILSHTQVLNDEVCVLVEPEPEALARGLEAALTDSALAARLVANARALYAREYTRSGYDRKIRQLIEIVG